MKTLLRLVSIALLAGCVTQQAPKRYAWVTGLKAEKVEYYPQLHARIWRGVERMIKKGYIRNLSFHEREVEGKLYLFAYLEYTGKDFDADMKKLATDPETQRWWKETESCQSPLPDAAGKGKIWSNTMEVYYLK